jgi:hypothetical protein
MFKNLAIRMGKVEDMMEILNIKNTVSTFRIYENRKKQKEKEQLWGCAQPHNRQFYRPQNNMTHYVTTKQFTAIFTRNKIHTTTSL